MELPSILLPFGLGFGPTHILPAQLVGNEYWVDVPIGSAVGEGLPIGVGLPLFDSKDSES